MAAPQVVDVTTICTSFPELPTPTLPRENLLVALETMLTGEIQLVIVEGSEGSGKTTLLAQFAQRNMDRSVSIFIRPTSWFTNDPEILAQDLANQMRWLATREELPSRTPVDEAVLRRVVYELTQFAARRGKKVVCIIDGFDSIPKERSFVKAALLKQLPFGSPHFKFIFSGDSESLLKHEPLRALLHKPFQVPPFSREETASLFGDSLKADFVKEIYEVCKGLPGYLATIQRLLRTGIDADTLLHNLPASLPKLFDIEWRHVDLTNRFQLDLLAFLSHDKNSHSLHDLSTLFNVSQESITLVLAPLSFVVLPAIASLPVAFVSDAFRTYASHQLRNQHSEVSSSIVDSLLQNPESSQALRLLPSYLNEHAKHQALLEYLSPERFERLFETSNQLGPLQQNVQLGMRTAIHLNKDDEIFRFGIQAATLADLNGFDVSRAEIEARMALGQIDKSEALAQGAVLKEDRLRLLAVIGRNKKEKNLLLESEFLAQLEKLFKEVDWQYLAAYATELAGDLIYCRPDLASHALAKASAFGQRTKDRHLDLALASLSIRTAATSSSDVVASEQIKQHIKDPVVQQFTSAVSALVKNYSAEAIIKEVDNLTRPMDKLFLLRQWTAYVSETDNAAHIIEFALALGIKTTEYSPNATHLRELATALRLVAPGSKLQELLRMFDAQRGTVEPVGPTVDYVRLQLLLAMAESRMDFAASTSRLVDTYLFIHGTDNIGSTCPALAYFMSALAEMDPKQELEKKETLHSLVKNDFKIQLNKLLTNTADHGFITRSIFDALAHTHTDLALDIVGSLNLENTRDEALKRIIRALLRVPLGSIKFSVIPSICGRFADQDERDDAIDDVVQRVALTTDTAALDAVLDSVVPIFRMGFTVTNIIDRTRICSGTIMALRKAISNKYDTLLNEAISRMREGLQKTDNIWTRLDGAFDITAALAKDFPELAKEYLQIAERLRETVGLQNSGSNFQGALSLAIRAYSGLVSNNIDSREDLLELKSRLDKIDSVFMRVRFWSEISMKMFRDERRDEAVALVNQEIWPLLAILKENDPDLYRNCLDDAAPALYNAHSKSALDAIRELPTNWSDSALFSIAEFIFKREPFWEPYETSDSDGYKLAWTDCLDLCEIISNIERDSFIYQIVTSIVVSIKKSRTELSTNQKAELFQRLKSLIDAKLPSARFIRHQGFKIVCNAQLLRLQRTTLAVWEQLSQEANGIGNQADRAMVLSTLAHCCRGAEPLLSERLIRQAKSESDSIPSMFDRVDRLIIIGQDASDIDISLARMCTREALELTRAQEGRDFDSLRKKTIDLAYDLSPELASSLISAFDDDPVRRRKRQLAKHIEIREFKKQLIEGSPVTKFDKSDESLKESLPRVAWMCLATLNAGKAVPIHLSALRSHLETASQLPLRNGYPILAWCIENAARRRLTGDKSQAQRTLQGIFKATMLGCDVSEKLSARVTAGFKSMTSSVGRGQDSSIACLVKENERGKAIDFILHWLERNASEYIKICDPFLGPEETVELLGLILRSTSDIPVYLVTSKKHHLEKKTELPYSDTYRRLWTQDFVQSPPETIVIVAGLSPSQESPIHDRWIITKNAGLRLGTSFNGLGIQKHSEISQMDAAALATNEEDLNNFIQQRRNFKGKIISYETFSL